MKRLLSFLLGASVLFIFGCNTTPDPVLTVSPENLAFSAEGGVQTVQVKANNLGQQVQLVQAYPSTRHPEMVTPR